SVDPDDIDDTGADDTGADDTGPDDTDPPADACPAAHTWLPDAPVVIEATHVPDLSFEQWQVDLWLFTNGLGWLTPTAYGVDTWRVRYRTQDRGGHVEATGIVSVPVVGT